MAMVSLDGKGNQVHSPRGERIVVASGAGFCDDRLDRLIETRLINCGCGRCRAHWRVGGEYNPGGERSCQQRANFSFQSEFSWVAREFENRLNDYIEKI